VSDEKDETVFQPSQGAPATPKAADEAAAKGDTAPAQDAPDDEEEGTVFAASPAQTPTVTPTPATTSPAPAASHPTAPVDAPTAHSGDGDEEGTVFAPPSASPPGSPSAPPTAASADDEGTVFAAPAAAAAAPPPPSPPPASSSGGSPRNSTIQVGAVLNHMFEVKRFLARGGMGEVFEGVNIASGERVAIKVILPELAADPNVMAMFQKEAQALTNLSHPAVVRYRGFALEPQLGVYYIATGFIDGRNLSDIVGKSTFSEDELYALTRRLAEGLKEAHELGVVHRDISPDNVILDNDRLDRPKIIDFGIVKETDPGSKTIIGDGFAGKPSYVAPEQLGDFDKQIGPCSDVYSLALVTLALAQGRKPDLGGLPAESIMKRRNGVDTSEIPDRLRPVIDAMLVADPQARLRSMDAVIAALDKAMSGKPPKPKKAKAAATEGAPRRPLPPTPVLIGGGAVFLAAVLAGVGYLAFSGGEDTTTQVGGAAAGSAQDVTLEQVNAAVQGEVSKIPCSWLTMNTGKGQDGFTITGMGVAGSPLDAEAVVQAPRKLGVEPNVDFAGIAKIDQSYCPILDELAKFRDSAPERMARKQPEYELEQVTEGEYAGEIGTHVVTDLSLDGIVGDYSLYAIEKSNVITQFVENRNVLPQAVNGTTVQKLPGAENYRLDIETNAKPGWSGIVLITGKGGFTPDALNDLVTPAGKAAFEQRAKANDWKVQIVWYKFVDNVPN